MTEPEIRLTARLIVHDPDAAMSFYAGALGAVELRRDTTPDGTIVHAEVQIGPSVFFLTTSRPDLNPAPGDLGGSPVICHLQVPDASATERAMVRNGATVLIEVADQDYGSRDGRLVDPFGHVWQLSQPL